MRPGTGYDFNAPTLIIKVTIMLSIGYEFNPLMPGGNKKDAHT